MPAQSLPINFTPSDGQKRILSSTKRYVVLSCGTRFGKSMSASALFVKRVFADVAAGKVDDVPATGDRRRRPRYLAWVVAPTYSLLQYCIGYVRSMIPVELVEQWLDSELTLWIKGGVKIQFKSCDRPETLVGAGCRGILLDESARASGETWRGSLRSRLVEHRGWAILATTPYNGRSSWVYQDFIAKKSDPDVDVISYRTIDSPFISAAEIEDFRRTLPDRFYRRELLADWESFQGAIYDELDPAIHVATPEAVEAEYRWPAGILRNGTNGLRVINGQIVIGMDFGWTDPTAIVVLIDTGEELIAVEEVKESNMLLFDPAAQRTVATELARLRAKWGPARIYADPARPDSIFQLVRAGFNVTGARNDIDAGLRRVAERLHPDGKRRPRLRILSTCPQLAKDLTAYHWHVDRDGNTVEKPDPRCDDHLPDALRYAVIEVDGYKRTGNERHGIVSHPTIGTWRT